MIIIRKVLIETQKLAADRLTQTQNSEQLEKDRIEQLKNFKQKLLDEHKKIIQYFIILTNSLCIIYIL
jgi:hypothetical protein